MDVTLNNVLEGTRQYFMGLPKQAQGEGSGQQMWPAGGGLPEEGAPAQSGAPAPSSRPPSAAAAPPSTPGPPPADPPRPPSEPIEPEPHIIHKATVMREALEKRREQPEEDDEASGALSPPTHIIRKPPAHTVPSPAPAPAAPSPSPARPPSPPPEPEQSVHRPPSARGPTPGSRPPEPYTAVRPPDPYPASRPPETYARYHYETRVAESGRTSHGQHAASPQPSSLPRHSQQQSYGRITSSMPVHSATRMRESLSHSQRYAMPVSQPPPHNDRVPPIHHPSVMAPSSRMLPADSRSAQLYPMAPRRDSSPYDHNVHHLHHTAHPPVAPRKYDPQQAYPGYRPSPPAAQPVQNHRLEPQHHLQNKHVVLDSSHYVNRPPERPVSSGHSGEPSRTPRVEHNSVGRPPADARGSYHYASPSTSHPKFAPGVSVPVATNSTLPSRSTHRPSSVSKSTYEYNTPNNHVQTSPVRPVAKPGYANQQSRMTVSVTSLVNQMNQTKQKRESPLDLSVKTVKNSADSSTTQDDMVDSATLENKPVSLQPRIPHPSRHAPLPGAGYVSSLKVDFAPDFQAQYSERNSSSHNYNPTPPVPQHVRMNGAYEAARPPMDSYNLESRQQMYVDRPKFSGHAPSKNEFVTQIDLTRPVIEQRYPDSRIRDDRHYVIEERKRPSGPIVSNIPGKVMRHETWNPDSRMDRMNRSAREQQELMTKPVYNYLHSHKLLESYRGEVKNQPAPNPYRVHHPPVNSRYPYPPEPQVRVPAEYHNHYPERHPSSHDHHVIQKIPTHREIPPHHHHHSQHHLPVEHHGGIPADKRVLSILRNSLETKQTGLGEVARPARQIPDLIVIDDGDDAVIEITDLTKDNESENNKVAINSKPMQPSPVLNNSIHMPKAVDSIAREPELRPDFDPKSRSPENDVASRIRTKAELKVMPPSEEIIHRTDETVENHSDVEKCKILPKSQKQHLFNQIREDNLRLESVIKSENNLDMPIAEVKTEPMSIEDIEKDVEISIKTEKNLESEPMDKARPSEFDLDWASACDNFMEQLKTGCHKKKQKKKRTETEASDKTHEASETDKNDETVSTEQSFEQVPKITIKQEPLDDEEIVDQNKPETSKDKMEVTEEMKDETVAKDTKVVEEKKVVKEKTVVANEKKLDKNDASDVEKNKDKVLEKKQKVGEKKTKLDGKKVVSERNKPEEDKKLKDKDVKKVMKKNKDSLKSSKGKEVSKTKEQTKSNKNEASPNKITIKKEKEIIQTVIKQECESTDDDEPLIKSKLIKEKEESDRLKYQLLKDLSEKSAYVKLECFDVESNKSNRNSLDSIPLSKEKEVRDTQTKGKKTRHISRSKGKSLSIDTTNDKIKVESSDSDSDDVITVASRLRLRKSIKTEEKTPTKSAKSPIKKQESSSNNSTPLRKPVFGDGSTSNFHPGWEEELYKYKRSLRMPTRLIAIPRGRSGGPFAKGSSLFIRGSTSLPDLDPAPLSPAPSSAPSAATDDLFARRQEKLALDSDLESNSSYSAPNRLHYDSEASTSTVFSSSKMKKKAGSIVDVLIQKCGRKDDSKRKNKEKSKEDSSPKVIPKNTSELLPTPSLGLVKNGTKGTLSAKKEKLMEDIFYFGAFRKETVSNFRNAFINNTDGLIGATEEFAPIVLKSRTRTESRVLKQRATIKEVFGDERPASAPPTSCREEEDDDQMEQEQAPVEIKKEPEDDNPKLKLKTKKLLKDKMLRRSSSIRDGLRSTKSLKRNDAKGRLMRLKKRNNLMKLANKKRELPNNKQKKDKSPTPEDGEKTTPKEATTTIPPAEGGKKRFKRLFARRKFSSGFDYIRKKKKLIRRDENAVKKVRRHAPKPMPESVHDIHKEIKGWFVNKSIGETSLHRAARLGYTDCVAYCLEKMGAEPSAKDNAGFTPLHVAAAKGHVRIGRLLLQYGANVSAAAQGGIRPLHEASENSHVEMIRLLLSYGADPLLGTYAGQTPVELAEGPAVRFLQLHIADVQGHAVEPWIFPSPFEVIDPNSSGCDPLASPPSPSPPPTVPTLELQCTEAPLPPFYSLKPAPGQPCEGLWCLLQDITTLLQIKSKDSLLKQIHCGSGSPKELLQEIRTQEFLERAQCHQLMCAGEKVNVRASKVALVRVTDKLRQLLKVETVLVS